MQSPSQTSRNIKPYLCNLSGGTVSPRNSGHSRANRQIQGQLSYSGGASLNHWTAPIPRCGQTDSGNGSTATACERAPPMRHSVGGEGTAQWSRTEEIPQAVSPPRGGWRWSWRLSFFRCLEVFLNQSQHIGF